MPFNATTGYSFSEAGIATYAPSESGVYGIYNNIQWIFVGESENIEKHLYAHLRRGSQQSYCILSRSPTHFVFDLGDEMWRKIRQEGLVKELMPACNWTLKLTRSNCITTRSKFGRQNTCRRPVLLFRITNFELRITILTCVPPSPGASASAVWIWGNARW